MKLNIIFVAAVLISIMILTVAGSIYTFAQQTVSAQLSELPTNITDLEQRLYQLEVTQAQYIQALKASNDAYQTSMTWFSIFVTVLVSVLLILQGSVFYVQHKTDGRREQSELRGVDEVTKVMTLVENTLSSRITAEQKIGPLNEFIERFRGVIREARISIEDSGKKLAYLTGQQFRSRSDELFTYSQLFDDFHRYYGPMDERGGKFGAIFLYVRGIAAHYANKPTVEKNYLSEVIGFHQPEEGEKAPDYKTRMINAYYYLGLLESNFGNYERAIGYFKEAKPDENEDFPMLLALAEAYMMKDDLANAQIFIVKAEAGLRARNRESDRRILSRTIIMKASIPILDRRREWANEAQRILAPVIVEDPGYYFGAATLGQIYLAINEKDRAKELFTKAHDSIVTSNDLSKVKEARVRIHLLMVAGLSSIQGAVDTKKAEKYLNEASALVNELPSIDSLTCTVFSNLSKRNEKVDIIRKHIDSIREGKFLA